MKLHTNEVNIGHATVLRHIHGGWVLPGGERMYRKPEVRDVASRMDDMITQRMTAIRLAQPAPLPEVSVTRRDVSRSKDAQRWVIAHA